MTEQPPLRQMIWGIIFALPDVEGSDAEVATDEILALIEAELAAVRAERDHDAQDIEEHEARLGELESELVAIRRERDNWRSSTQELRDEMEQWDFDEEVSRMRGRAEKAEQALAAVTATAEWEQREKRANEAGRLKAEQKVIDLEDALAAARRDAWDEGYNADYMGMPPQNPYAQRADAAEETE